MLFNAYAPELWRRFTIGLRRTLARQAGLTSKAFAAQARLSYAKVAEYQRRGVVRSPGHLPQQALRAAGQRRYRLDPHRRITRIPLTALEAYVSRLLAERTAA